MKNVVIFGDSILKGIVLQDGRYTISQAVAWDKIEEKLNVKIKNMSKMGTTVMKSEERILDYIEKNAGDIHRVVLEFGGNDSDYDWQTVMDTRSKDYRPKTECEYFEATLCNIIDSLREKNIAITMMTLPPISAGKYFKWITKENSSTDKENMLFFLGDIEIIYRRQEMYSNVVVQVANAYGIDLVDVRFKFLSHDDFPSLLCEDGIHPNEKGENLIAESFLEFYSDLEKE
jgi:lysophospholipase L1-like esterase